MSPSDLWRLAFRDRVQLSRKLAHGAPCRGTSALHTISPSHVASGRTSKIFAPYGLFSVDIDPGVDTVAWSDFANGARRAPEAKALRRSSCAYESRNSRVNPSR